MIIVDRNIRDIIANVRPAQWILIPRFRTFSDEKKRYFIRCILLNFNVFTN